MNASPLRTQDWHADFLRMLPKIQEFIRFKFRHWKRDDREEATQEIVCHCCLAYARLVERGRADGATWSSLAKYALVQFCDGRRVGTNLNIKDVSSAYCQRRKLVTVRNLQTWDHRENIWRDMLIEDKTATPANLAAARIDFPAWLETLNRRNRQIALKLSQGEDTGHVAKLFRLSKGRVSQLRRELFESWRAFHGDAAFV